MAAKERFKAEYTYDARMLRVFCRVHRWYRKRQHPLFFCVPGVFLAASVLYTALSGIAGIRELTPTTWVQLILMGVFALFLLWMGFVSPYVFRKTMLANLKEPEKLKVRVLFYEDHLRAENSLSSQELPYSRVSACYVTQQYLFLYGQGDAAIIVPSEAVPERERKAFEAFIREKLSGRLKPRRYAEVLL